MTRKPLFLPKQTYNSAGFEGRTKSTIMRFEFTGLDAKFEQHPTVKAIVRFIRSYFKLGVCELFHSFIVD
jgi:hypothetical protein